MVNFITNQLHLIGFCMWPFFLEVPAFLTKHCRTHFNFTFLTRTSLYTFDLLYHFPWSPIGPSIFHCRSILSDPMVVMRSRADSSIVVITLGYTTKVVFFLLHMLCVKRWGWSCRLGILPLTTFWACDIPLPAHHIQPTCFK